MKSTAIEICNVSKKYNIYENNFQKIKRLFGFKYNVVNHKYALTNISLNIEYNSVLGIIGENGSGKSTILQLIAGILKPNEGSITRNNKVVSILELGSGFNNDFTGRENIYINGRINGYSKKEIDTKIIEIIDFSGLEDNIDNPIKTYSAGMMVRLAFSVLINMDPKILLIDEVLSVGDIFFQNKCHQKLEEIINNGVAVIIVSHDMRVIQKYADKVLLLNKGVCEYYGDPKIAVSKYYMTQNNDQNSIKRGNNSYRLVDLQILDASLKPRREFNVGDEMVVKYFIETDNKLKIPVGSVLLNNILNITVTGKDTTQYNNIECPLECMAGDLIEFTQSFKLNIAEGDYSIDVGFGEITPESDAIKHLYSFHNSAKIKVNSSKEFRFHGYVYPEGYCKINKK